MQSAKTAAASQFYGTHAINKDGQKVAVHVGIDGRIYTKLGNGPVTPLTDSKLSESVRSYYRKLVKPGEALPTSWTADQKKSISAMLAPPRSVFSFVGGKKVSEVAKHKRITAQDIRQSQISGTAPRFLVVTNPYGSCGFCNTLKQTTLDGWNGEPIGVVDSLATSQEDWPGANGYWPWVFEVTPTGPVFISGGVNAFIPRR